jgi:histidine triad (HIT) family protein
MSSTGPANRPPCVFCAIVERRSPAHVLYEDATSMAFLDIFPFTRGHFLVIPKHHAERLTDLPEERQFDLIRALDRMCRRVGRLAPDYNVALNAGAAAGQIVFHVHFHVIPRYGEANPFHLRAREPLPADEAKSLVAELGRP